MRNRWLQGLVMMVLVSLSAVFGRAEAVIGKPAPLFVAKGSDGKEYRLADLKGKFVVLQWYNKDCPFIHKHYDSANMQMLQNSYGKKGVIWFEVASSAPGRE